MSTNRTVKSGLDLTDSARLGRNHDRRREAGSGVDGTDAQPSAERRAQAPEPRSGAPEAPGCVLGMSSSLGVQVPCAT